jgi:hypothetical protein
LRSTPIVCPISGCFAVFYRYEASPFIDVVGQWTVMAPSPFGLHPGLGREQGRGGPTENVGHYRDGFVEFWAVRPCSIGMERSSGRDGASSGADNATLRPPQLALLVPVSPTGEWPGTSAHRYPSRRGWASAKGSVAGSMDPSVEGSVLDWSPQLAATWLVAAL